MSEKEEEKLFWHCLQCGAHEPVEPTRGDGDDYELGDKEPCISCEGGTAHVVTVKRGAAYEQGRALGLNVQDAWKRALRLTKDAAPLESLKRRVEALERAVSVLSALGGERVFHTEFECPKCRRVVNSTLYGTPAQIAAALSERQVCAVCELELRQKQ